MFSALSRPLSRQTSDSSDPVAVWLDEALLGDSGVLVGFSERGGGVSEPPFDSLDLAAHVGDEAASVDENRSRLLGALGLSAYRDNLTMAEQIHASRIAVVDAAGAGAGAYAAGARPPLAGTDAIITLEVGVPVALCFADCVPIILVAPGPAIAVVHAGWRGALSSLAGTTAVHLAEAARCEVSAVSAYIGPHIRDCHYEVGPEIMSQFFNTFGTLARASSGRLDLDAVVSASLDRAGVAPCNIARLGTCTAEATDRFFSYRAEGGETGRHAAVACIIPHR